MAQDILTWLIEFVVLGFVALVLIDLIVRVTLDLINVIRCIPKATQPVSYFPELEEHEMIPATAAG